MTSKNVFNTLGMQDAIDQSFMDDWEQAEAEAEEHVTEQVQKILMKYKQERSNENDHERSNENDQ